MERGTLIAQRIDSSALESSGLGLEWEETCCPLCEHSDGAPLLEAEDQLGGPQFTFLVMRCPHCELCYTNPRPSVSAIGRYYPENYKPHRDKQATQAPSGWRRWLPWRRGQSRPYIPLHGQRRLLDFGCGGGSFLLAMRSRGWMVTGLDVSAATVARLRADHELNVFHGTLPTLHLTPESFDVITMWQSLEHVHEPLTVLRAAHDLLVPGGKIVVAVPNIDSWPFRWFGPAWFALDLPRHLTHFSPATLCAMLRRAGFEPGKVRQLRTSAWLRHSAERLQAVGKRTGWSAFLRSRLGSTLASWCCRLFRRCDNMMVAATKS